MTRVALAVAIALCLSPVSLYAQSSRFTVTSTSAPVYQAPSAGSQVIAQRSQGTVLDVRRQLVDWVEVAWPSAPRGIAYVRAATGSIEKPGPAGAATDAQRPLTIDEFVHGRSPAPGQTSASASDQSNPAAYVAEAVGAVSAASTPRPRVTTPNATYVAPAHFVGLGARLGDPAPSFGATGRVWTRARVGVQFEVFHNATSNAATAERVTSLQIAPSVLYALPNAVSDYIWLRPYIGGGASIDHSTLSSSNPADMSSTTDSSIGFQMFGGGEVTFAGMPRFALSADIGYRKTSAAFVGFEPSKLRFALSGHWFVR